MNYLRYAPGVETVDDGEQEAIDGIIKAMTHQSEIVAKREHHAVRASHAKSTALVTGTLTIEPDLPPELAQGLFATPASYDVAIRFAQGPGETLSDHVSTHRGMAVKIFGVTGDKLGSHRSDTQDFVFASGPTFPSGTAKGFLRDEKLLETSTPMPEGVKSAVSSAMRATNTLLKVFGTQSAFADFFGHPFSHPLSEPYFSQAPYRYGDYVAKLAFVPSDPAMLKLVGQTLDPAADPNVFRTAMTEFLRSNDAEFEVQVQLWANPDSQPLEDTSVEWPETDSVYRTVATISIPAQASYSDARERYFDDVLSFKPAHTLSSHRPLGSVMRARLQVYDALSRFRHENNRVAVEEPNGVDQIPA
ncbi:MAG: catalase family protein [Janthinobacterium lividum]